MLDWQRHAKLRIFIKTICIVLIVSFLSYDLAWAGATEVFSSRNRQAQNSPKDSSPIEIPQELGVIKDSYTSKYNPYKLVIHIQDAHANVEAQENEAKLIKHLKDKYNIHLVAVEGGFGDFDAEFFRSFPKDKKIRDKIAKYFLSKAFISGTDYLLITENEPPTVYGAEDKELYASHLNTFKENQAFSDSLNSSLKAVEDVIDTLKNKYYSKDLREFAGKADDFRLGRISLDEYISYLNIASIIHSIDLSKFPNLSRIINLQELEHKINFEKAESERQDLIDSLTKALSKADLEEMVKKSLDFKANKLTPAEYYSYLEKLTQKSGINSASYNNLLTYIKYIALSENLDNSKVFEEIDAFSEAVKNKLTTTSAQRDIEQVSNIIRILEGLSNINLSPKDYEYFKGNREVFNSKAIASLLRRYSNSSVLNSLPADSEIASLEKFYSLAHDRDDAMVRNSLNRLNHDYSSNSVIIVAGGFHTAGLTSILKEKDISYIVIAPSIKSNPDKETTYFALLKDKRLPLEDVLNDPDTLQIINSISDPEARQILVSYWVARASRYYSIKELQAQLDRLRLSTDDQRAVEVALNEVSSRTQLAKNEETVEEKPLAEVKSIPATPQGPTLFERFILFISSLKPKPKETKLTKQEIIPTSHEEVKQGGIGAGGEGLSVAPLPAQDKKSSSPVKNTASQDAIVNPVAIIPNEPTLIERFAGLVASLKPKPKPKEVATLVEDKKESLSKVTTVQADLNNTQKLAELFRLQVFDAHARAEALEILGRVLKEEGFDYTLTRFGENFLLVTRQLFLRPDSKAQDLIKQFNLTKDDLIDIYRVVRLTKSLQELIVSETEYAGFVNEMRHLLRYSDRLEKIFANQVVYPVIVEWHPGETCDSNCIFCYSRGMHYKDREQGKEPLSLERAQELLREFVDNGVREFWISGGKEPLTNPITGQVIKSAADLGLDVRLYTNGIRLDRATQEKILDCKQVRISLNAATPETYKQVQGINGENFNRVVKNIGDFVKLKKQKKAAVRIGMSFLLTPYNYKEIPKIAELAKELGVDFLAIRAEQVGTIRRFTQDEVSEILRLAEEIRIQQEIGHYGGLDLDIRSLTEKDLLGEKHYLPDMEKAKTCKARMIKMGMSPYGVCYMCEYAEHPRNAKPELEVGDVTKMSFKEVLERSNQIQHDPAKCEACMINEYGVNIILEKLKEDKDFGISLEDQPYRVTREGETSHQKPTVNLAYKPMQCSQKGFVLPELLVGLGGLGLIGLSIPLFIAGNIIFGSLTAILGISIFVAVLLKPSFQKIKTYVRSKLTIGAFSIGLLLSIIFGNPIPSSPGLNPMVPQENMPVVQTISKEHIKPVTPVYLPLYTQSEIRKQAGTYSLYLNKERSPAIFGMVYQPVPQGRHINEYRGNMAQLYKSLLNKSEGGQDHARMLHNLGIKAIRVYDISVDDAREIKRIFGKVFQDYGIRVYVGNFAGLYENKDYQNPKDRQRIIDNILKIVDTYRDEPWILGWQIGNEGNYYVINGKLGQRINLSLPEYYAFMDEVAGAIKQKLSDDLRQQIIILGNGDLTVEEASLISRMQNIDAVGINCFKDKTDIADLLKLAKEKISKPIIFSEIGLPARTRMEQQAQAQYLEEIISLLDENSIGRGKLGNVAMVFICEATDEIWKAVDSTKPEEAYLGILGKDSEAAVKGLLSEIERVNESVMPPVGVESEDLIKSAWQALEVKNYGLAIRYANDCVRLWSKEAQRQQLECLRKGEFPKTDLVKIGTNEFSGKKYDVYTREAFNYWALNDVGTA
ncbi:MAG: radical SAM protein, partial [Candidatus Omnitrophica bacterium]|nr:radical SAM protein [Candidatus Omnitrophota bacterium]